LATQQTQGGGLFPCRQVIPLRERLWMPSLENRYDVVLDYLAENVSQDPVYDWILRETSARGIPEIHITAIQGRFLNLLAHLIGARCILEVGALSGYSTVWLARALPAEGRLISLEMNATHAEMARESLTRAGVADRAEVIVGPALESMARLDLDDPLDMVFIDADKGNNGAYFAWARHHVRSEGLILIDNVLLNGRVVHQGTDFYRWLHAFNAEILSEYGDRASVVPFYKREEDNLDGILIVRVP
jgi:predicted O-methyltransferase YrrM